MNFTRYAIYYKPEPGALDTFGASWLGWDSADGMARAHPEIAGLPMPVAEITETPRKYGFHGTIKPPFYLAEGTDAQGLVTAIETLCGRLSPVTLDGLALSRLGRFLALTPQGDTVALARLAAQVVEELDGFRAPPGEAELAKRRAANLSPRQEANLQRWGYPYVQEEFRFHMTLSGKLSGEDLAAVADTLEPQVAPVLPRPFVIRDLTLLGQDQDGMFHQIHRFALTG